MTQKIYKTARGKIVDLGSLILQNENTRAVGNMNVNARGDVIDSANQVIERKNRQVQKQYNKQTNVLSTPVVSGTRELKRKKDLDQSFDFETVEKLMDTPVEKVSEPQEVVAVAEPEPVAEESLAIVEKEAVSQPTISGGLAAAIARSRVIKQELEQAPNSTKTNKVKKI